MRTGCRTDRLEVNLTTYNPDKHRRWSIRLQGYDYSSAGVYFVTICGQDRTWIGKIQMQGRIIIRPCQRMNHGASEIESAALESLSLFANNHVIHKHLVEGAGGVPTRRRVGILKIVMVGSATDQG